MTLKISYEVKQTKIYYEIDLARFHCTFQNYESYLILIRSGFSNRQKYFCMINFNRNNQDLKFF